MIVNETLGDVFEDKKGMLVHCISSDFVMGAGIAKAFTGMGVKKWLMENKPVNEWDGKGYCIICTIPEGENKGQFVANLVTKNKVWEKPTYESVKEALTDLKESLLYDNYGDTAKNLTMPYIASGLDGLEWKKVGEVIEEVFGDTDITINVKYRSEREKLPSHFDKEEHIRHSHIRRV